MSRNKGFTLIELMIAMAIIAIIAAIAFPAFTKSAMKGRRADAKAALTRHAQALERCYTQYGTYNNGLCSTEVNSSAAFIGATSDKGYYTISATSFSGVAYKLTATAVTSGPQANDTGCTVMNIDNTGIQSSGSSGSSTDTNNCW